MTQNAKNWLFDLPKKTKKVYSQFGQDGILEEIFSHIPTVNTPPYYVEFGFNSMDLYKGTGPNITNLYTKGWRGLLLDGGFDNPAINLYKEFLTSKNICSIFQKYNVPKTLDYLSVDVDTTDLWLTDAILKEYSPSVVSIEYNSNFPIHEAITFPDEPREIWQKDCIYGASAKALVMMMELHKYSLVCVDITDAFFISNDLVEGLEKPTLELFKGKLGLKKHKRCLNDRQKIMLDYEVYLRTGDVEIARKSTETKNATYLC